MSSEFQGWSLNYILWDNASERQAPH